MSNKKTNKNIAMVILGLILADTVGLLGAFNVNLATIPFLGYPIINVLLILGNAWVLYGLYSREIGA
jgi:hypothetical protein